MNAQEFNRRIPIGTSVLYFPSSNSSEFIAATTRTEAWELGSGQAVVSITGKSGGVSIAHIVPSQSIAFDGIGRFHFHLDTCQQCRENPFGLCSVGEYTLIHFAEAVR